MPNIDQSGLKGKTRDQPIATELHSLLLRAAEVADVDTVRVTSGGQPGSRGGRVGSTRHDGGRAADLQLVVDGRTLVFSDSGGNRIVERFVAAAAALGANGIGAGENYMGNQTLHVGFGTSPADTRKITWGAKGRSANAPNWLRVAANKGWEDPEGSLATHSDGAHEDPNEEGELRRDEPGAFDQFDEMSDQISVPKGFNFEVITAALASQRKWAIPASVTLAQWALESGFGKSMPSGSNNPFGVKATSGQPGSSAMTTEFENGVKVVKLQKFRKYPTIEAAFDDHGRLLATANPYKSARQFLDDPNRFADALTGVYATDPLYGSKLRSIMAKHDLYQFNNFNMESSDDLETGVDSPLKQGHPDVARVKALQIQLIEKGYALGKVDGVFGSLTAAALLSFQNDNNLPTTGMLDKTTSEALGRPARRPLDPARMAANEAVLAAEGSKVVIGARRNRILAWITTVVGALGVGNSAIINGAQSPPPVAMPEILAPFLADVQRLTPAASAAEHSRLAELARTLRETITSGSISPDAVQLVQQIRRAIPTDLLTRNPEIDRVFDTISKSVTTKQPTMTTVFDVLPTLFANDSILQTAMKGVAAVGASTLPGFSGSLGMLAAGLLARHFSNRISEARVQDHRNAGNVSR